MCAVCKLGGSRGVQIRKKDPSTSYIRNNFNSESFSLFGNYACALAHTLLGAAGGRSVHMYLVQDVYARLLTLEQSICVMSETSIYNTTLCINAGFLCKVLISV